uniref:Metallothionein n=1 Tax=Angiostrongylus cantonensis TaxID=6313 RepID=A0A0K0DB95_ANGCA
MGASINSSSSCNRCNCSCSNQNHSIRETKRCAADPSCHGR